MFPSTAARRETPRAHHPACGDVRSIWTETPAGAVHAKVSSFPAPPGPVVILVHGLVVSSASMLSTCNQWKRILARAPRGDFIGVDEDKYPRDFATFVRYHDDLIAKVPAQYPVPPPVALSDLESFIQSSDGNYRAEWR